VTLVGLYVADRVAVTRANRGDAATGTEQDRNTYLWILVWQMAGLAALLVAPRVLPSLDLPTWLWVPGLALAWVGIGLRVWAIGALGRAFRRVVTVGPDQEVVTSGPYRYVRHPSYTGLLFAFAGLGLAQANVASILGAIALPLVGYVRRIHVEEQALVHGLGDRYTDYAAGRARLIPHVW